MKRKILGVLAIPFIVFALGACEFPDATGEYPTLDTIDYGSCYVDASDPYNPVAGRDVTIEIKNNMPDQNDPDLGAMVVSDATDFQGNDLGLAWTDWSDEDGALFYTDSSTYNVVEPGQTASVTFFQSFPDSPAAPGDIFALWFFTDEDADSAYETDIFGDDVNTQGWSSISDLSCDVCPPGQVWDPTGPYCYLP